MIVRNSAAETALCITQLHHSNMTGALAQAWKGGNGIPEVPEPRHLVVQAAMLHDLGWLDWEGQPDTGTEGHPHDFLDMPKEHHLSIWKSGFDDARNFHPLAGLLVLRHNTTLARSGSSAGDSPELAAFFSWVKRQDKRLEAKLLADHALPGLSPEVLRDMNTFILLTDYISLRMCMGPEKESPFGPPPAYRDLRLSMEPDPKLPETFRIHPWPFSGDRFSWQAGAWRHPRNIPFGELGPEHKLQIDMQLLPAEQQH
ncbi:MAG: DUF3891 family protein [Balneolales bacterium]|nr:DUF3891 family protein [Balneolales bacterium]